MHYVSTREIANNCLDEIFRNCPLSPTDERESREESERPRGKPKCKYGAEYVVGGLVSVM